MPPIPEEKKLRSGDVAKILGVSTSQVRRLDQRRVLIPALVIPGSKHRYYTPKQVQDFMVQSKRESDERRNIQPIVSVKPKASEKARHPALLEQVQPVAPKPIPVPQSKPASTYEHRPVNLETLAYGLPPRKKKEYKDPYAEKNAPFLTGMTTDESLHAHVIEFVPNLEIAQRYTEMNTWKEGKWPWRYSLTTFEAFGVKAFFVNDVMFNAQDQIQIAVTKYEQEKGIIAERKAPEPKPPERERDPLDSEEEF